MSRLYKVFAILLVAGYAFAGLKGYEPGGGGDKREIPQNVRQSSAGWRSFHFWHAGIKGGK